MTIGERLKKWRKEKKLTTTEIQNITGISQAAISYYENNKREVSTTYITELYKKFNIDVIYILTGEKDENHLTDNQEQLIQFFNICDKEAQEDILRFARRCARSQNTEAATNDDEGKSSTYKIG